MTVMLTLNFLFRECVAEIDSEEVLIDLEDEMDMDMERKEDGEDI